MRDYNNDGKIDKEDYQIFEDLQEDYETTGNTSLPVILVIVIAVAVFLYFRYL